MTSLQRKSEFFYDQELKEEWNSCNRCTGSVRRQLSLLKGYSYF